MFDCLLAIPRLEVRLSGGLGPWEGRVEVKQDQQWKAVCDHGWDPENAQVVCRQLNYTCVDDLRQAFKNKTLIYLSDSHLSNDYVGPV